MRRLVSSDEEPLVSVARHMVDGSSGVIPSNSPRNASHVGAGGERERERERACIVPTRCHSCFRMAMRARRQWTWILLFHPNRQCVGDIDAWRRGRRWRSRPVEVEPDDTVGWMRGEERVAGQQRPSRRVVLVPLTDALQSIQDRCESPAPEVRNSGGHRCRRQVHAIRGSV